MDRNINFYNFSEFRASLLRFALVRGLLDNYERTNFVTVATADLKNAFADICHWFKDEDLIFSIIKKDDGKTLVNFIYQMIDVLDKRIISSKFKELLDKSCVLEQSLILSDQAYVLEDAQTKDRVNSINLLSGVTVVTGNWQAGKSTFLNAMEMRWKPSKSIFKYEFTTDNLTNKYNNIEKMVTTMKKKVILEGGRYKTEKLKQIYISEPDHQTFTFDLEEICDEIEKSTGPVFIDSVSKSEYYIKTLGLEKGVSSSIIPVVDSINFYAHKLPVILIGWSELQVERLSGSIVNLIEITGEGTSPREVTVYTRGRIKKPQKYIFRKINSK